MKFVGEKPLLMKLATIANDAMMTSSTPSLVTQFLTQTNDRELGTSRSYSIHSSLHQIQLALLYSFNYLIYTAKQWLSKVLKTVQSVVFWDCFGNLTTKDAMLICMWMWQSILLYSRVIAFLWFLYLMWNPNSHPKETVEVALHVRNGVVCVWWHCTRPKEPVSLALYAC